MIDLHTHSSASDGFFPPAQLVEYAASKGISTLALTDHDTIDGILEAQNEAQKLGVTFIPGIELSIEWPTGEFHLLGLGLKTVSCDLKNLIEQLRFNRIERNKKIFEKINEQGFSVSFEEFAGRFNNENEFSNLGRPHIARFLTEKGIVKNPQVAFDRFFANGKNCYVKKIGAQLSDAVKAIKSSGGIAVQAHPLSMYVSRGKMLDTMIGIQAEGVQGLEAYHSGTRWSQALYLEELASKLGMFVTAGSDFHGGTIRPDRKIGFTTCKTKIEDRFWEENLKPALEKIHGTEHTFNL